MYCAETVLCSVFAFVAANFQEIYCQLQIVQITMLLLLLLWSLLQTVCLQARLNANDFYFKVNCFEIYFKNLTLNRFSEDSRYFDILKSV